MSLFLIDIGTPVVFVHIPKTGGTSIREGRLINRPHALYDPLPSWPSDLPSFAFIRDPFDRIESCWRDFRYLRPQTRLGFRDFVKAMTMASPASVDDPATTYHHAAPMTHPVHGLHHARFVGHFDTLQQDFNLFCASIGVPTFTLPHYRSSSSHPRAPRTPETLDLVRSIYSADYDYMEDYRRDRALA